MKKRLLFNSSYFIFWIGYFFVARLLFLLFYYEQSYAIGLGTSLKTFLYGIQLDISFAGYLSIIPFLASLLTVWASKKIVATFMKLYSIVIILVVTLMVFIDLSLYKYWGVRIDATLLTYMNTPKVMLASVTTLQLIGGIVIWLLSSLIVFRILSKLVLQKIVQFSKGKLWEASVLLLVIAILIIPIRGGIQTIPINQSNVYFSKEMFANHAAINCLWNFTNTLTHRVDDHNPYQQFTTKDAKTIIQNTRKHLTTTSKDTILNTEKPNVILLIWESLSAKAVGSLEGEPEVTSNFNMLSKEGILFTNFYGNGDRTDKGLAAILSGYYPQPTSSIIKMPHKTRKLPMLTKAMKQIGYTTSFHYGGDMNFGNMNTYLRNGDIDCITDGSIFDDEDWNSKWGAHDHIFLEHIMHGLSKTTSTTDDCYATNTPFFKIILTLTSHEPYEFPGEYKFGKKSDEALYRSSQAYTDKAIGKFIQDAKAQPWWDNTLIIILSDHGHPLPKHKGYFNSPKKFHIPMLWLGGALAKIGIKIDNFSAQTDLSYTLMSLLGGNANQFSFGKNIFNTTTSNYAHFIFNKGFGTISKEGTFVYDYVSQKPIIQKGDYKSLEVLGKALTQDAYQDFIDR